MWSGGSIEVVKGDDWLNDWLFSYNKVSLPRMNAQELMRQQVLLEGIEVIGFDADDTLWENARYFSEVEATFCGLMTPYMTQEAARMLLFKVEQRNMPWYGYGVMAFTLSLVEAAVEGSGGKVPAADIQRLLTLGRCMLQRPVVLLPGVAAVLPLVASARRLVVVTKGDLLDQERKLKASGLLPYFHHIEIVTDKKVDNYQQLFDTLSIPARSFLMVGNSLRSDIQPVITLGGHAIHIPQPDVWPHEHADIPTSAFLRLSSMAELPAVLGLG